MVSTRVCGTLSQSSNLCRHPNMLSKSIKETEKIAEKFLDGLFRDANRKKGALVVGLSGELGAGKTAFTKAIAKHLGVKDRVFSPTFVIIKKYALSPPKGSAQKTKGPDFKFLFHIDAYRLKNEKEVKNLGWEEIMGNQEHLVFIEWPENISKALPKNSKTVYISTNKDGHRKFKFR